MVLFPGPAFSVWHALLLQPLLEEALPVYDAYNPPFLVDDKRHPRLDPGLLVAWPGLCHHGLQDLLVMNPRLLYHYHIVMVVPFASLAAAYVAASLGAHHHRCLRHKRLASLGARAPPLCQSALRILRRILLPLYRAYHLDNGDLGYLLEPSLALEVDLRFDTL